MFTGSHTLHLLFSTFISLLISIPSLAANETELRKTHLEDIFIWKMSDELKLSAKEEKEFTEVSKNLNHKKSELNRQIQEMTATLSESSSEADLRKYKKLLQDYNEVSIAEFDSIKKILGAKKFVSYLKIKSELTGKMKSILIGEKNTDKKEINSKSLPAPKVIVERGN